MGDWIYTFNGPIGLRREAIKQLRDDLSVPIEEYQAMRNDIRIMESAALHAMLKKRPTRG